MARIAPYLPNHQSSRYSKRQRVEETPFENRAAMIGHVSKLNSKTGKQEFTLTISSDEPFSFVSCNLDEPSPKHDYWKILVKRTPFALKRLPAEVRCMIYDLVLMQEEDMALSIQSLADDSHLFLFKKDHRKIPNLTALLQVDRMVHSEVAARFYAMRRFEFNTPETSVKFLRAIGQRNRSRLRKITIDQSSKMSDSESFEFYSLLRDATHMEKITFTNSRGLPWYWSDGRAPRDLACAHIFCKPMVVQTRNWDKVLDIFDIAYSLRGHSCHLKNANLRHLTNAHANGNANANMNVNSVNADIDTDIHMRCQCVDRKADLGDFLMHYLLDYLRAENANASGESDHHSVE